MISQEDLDLVNDYYWGINFNPEFKTSRLCDICQGDGYYRYVFCYAKICETCDGIGLIELENANKTKT